MTFTYQGIDIEDPTFDETHRFQLEDPATYYTDGVYTVEQLTALLKDHFADVELWQTGGGCMNPVIVIERDGHTKDAILYVMFSDGWSRGEASFGLYDERRTTSADGFVQDVTDANVTNPPILPWAIANLITTQLHEWEVGSVTK